MKKLLLATLIALFASAASPAFASTDLFVSTTGYVGIGTTSPTDALVVTNGGIFATAARNVAIANSINIDFDGGSLERVIGNGANTSTLGELELAVSSSNGTLIQGGLFVDPHANIGIAQSNPAQALEVNGKVQVDTFGSATSSSVCELGGVLSSCSSSLRYKENVKSASFGLKEVMAMRPVTFKWKGRDEQDFGLIAEDVEKVNPLFVTYKKDRTLKDKIVKGEITKEAVYGPEHVEGVKYPQLTAVLIKAIQELKKDNDDLRAEFAEYKKSHP